MAAGSCGLNLADDRDAVLADEQEVGAHSRLLCSFAFESCGGCLAQRGEFVIDEAERQLGPVFDLPPALARPIGKEEIVERLIFPMINEGARILDEGIAMRPGDIDVIYVYGYGWPVWRGGPMFYADQVGLDKVVSSIQRFQDGYQGAQWQPAPLLAKLAKEGRRFNG